MRRLTPHLGNLLSANQFFDTLKRYDRQMPAVPFFRFIISEPAGEKPGWIYLLYLPRISFQYAAYACSFLLSPGT